MIEELRPEDTPRGRFCFPDIADLVGRQSYRLAMCPWPPCPSSESHPMDLVFAPSQIEAWPIARLHPYACFAKMHGDDQVAKIAAMAEDFDLTLVWMLREMQGHREPAVSRVVV